MQNVENEKQISVNIFSRYLEYVTSENTSALENEVTL
jgi:hypothetical protein